jgi:hypothetical protein
LPKSLFSAEWLEETYNKKGERPPPFALGSMHG